MQIHSPTSAGLVAAVLAASVVACVAAQEPADPPRDTVVALLHLPEGAVADATNSMELVAALREHLTVDLAMPLDETLSATLSGWAGAEGGDFPAYNFALGSLGVSYGGNDRLDGFSYALAVRESHGDDFPSDGDAWEEVDAEDWDEDKAWEALVKALDAGLPQSASGFERPAPGAHVALQVGDVHVHDFDLAADDPGWADHDWCCLEQYEGAVLQLRLDASFQSSVMGDPAADDLSHRRNILVIELAP